MTEYGDLLAANLAVARERIDAAARRAGRDPGEVALIAVTKTQPLERVRLAYGAGLRVFGENRVQEARDKIAAWDAPGVTWHLVGHLQGNKAGLACRLFAVVQSVDSAGLARRLDGCRPPDAPPLPVLLEVNAGRESSKLGFLPGDAFWQAVPEILALPGLDVWGLMTVAPLAADPETVRPVFRELREIRDELRRRYPERPWPHLSMGMSDDYAVAVEEGATMVRLGRALFGPRA